MVGFPSLQLAQPTLHDRLMFTMLIGKVEGAFPVRAHACALAAFALLDPPDTGRSRHSGSRPQPFWHIAARGPARIPASFPHIDPSNSVDSDAGTSFAPTH